MNFADRLIAAILAKRSYLCVGLDPQLRYFPPHILKHWAQRHRSRFEVSAGAILDFNKAIINATWKYAACYKPQRAFYEAFGSPGIRAFELTVEYLHSMEALVIEDAKREDGGDTADAYANGHLGTVQVINTAGELEAVRSPYDIDAITVTAWIDQPMLQPFRRVVEEGEGKGVFVVVKTSFKPESSFQEMEDASGEKAWVKMARVIADLGTSTVGEHGYSSIGVVMGATYPKEAEIMRELIPHAFKLVPGFGFQGGGPDDAVVCFNNDGFGGIVNNSRGTNYAWHTKFKSDFQGDPRNFAYSAGREAKKSRDALNEAVRKKNGFLPWERQ